MASTNFISFLVLILFNKAVLGKDTAEESNNIEKSSETFQREICVGLPNPVVLKWIVNLSNQEIQFYMTAPTKGYIWFGISRRLGPIDGIIGGVFSNGIPYFQDMHAKNDTTFPEGLKVDALQNWHLLKAHENSSHTTISFKRKLATCDDLHDVLINRDTLTLHWGYDIGDLLHASKTFQGGNFSIILLNPNPIPKFEPKKSWDLIQTHEVVAGRTTSYWCTIHKGLDVDKKHHLITFTPYFEDDLARKHVHHFVVYKCHKPPASQSNKAYFERYLNTSGGECYESPPDIIPTRHCRTFLYTWAYGGKAFSLPETAGIAVGEEEDEYFMLEVHIDNPEASPNLRITAGVKIRYTDKLRPMDAGMFMMGNEVGGTFTIPPKSNNFSVYGHCGSNCTWNNLPPEGIKIFGVLLHSHLKGRELRLHHYRENQELDWIASDVNYDFSYQQTRFIPSNGGRRVLPGDHLMIRCTFNNVQSNGSTVGGFSTREEMCLGFVWYYPKIPLQECSSAYPFKSLVADYFGITKTKRQLGLIQPVIVEPSEWANKTLSEFMDKDFNWTPENREKLQSMFQDGQYDEFCSVPGKGTFISSNTAKPNNLEHIYEESCGCNTAN